MKNIELSDLKEKKKAYDDIIDEVARLLPLHEPESAYCKAIQSMLRTLQNQQRMIEYAIKSREAKT